MSKGYQRIWRDDGWMWETAYGKACIAGTYAVPVAAQFGMVQLFNPADSGIVAYVKRMRGCSVQAGLLEGRVYNLALANNVAYPIDKNIGGAIPACLLQVENNVAALGVVFAAFNVGALQEEEFLGADPIRLEESEGLVVTINVVNIGVSGFYEWVERDR